jgi:hypothetical protein
MFGSELSMRARRRRNIGDVPYLGTGFLSDDVGRRLGPVAQTEFREQVAHVVLDGLPCDEQAIADLRVGQPGPDQLQDLVSRLSTSRFPWAPF